MDKFLRATWTRDDDCANSKTVPATSSLPGNDSPCTASKLSDQATCASIPSDIARPGDDIKHHKLSVYPKNKENRSFQASWFQKFKWLEYSREIDAAFCYACRQFQPFGSKENAFTSSGYRNWRTALSKGKGFEKHLSSQVHVKSMLAWQEKEKREQMGTSVSTMLNYVLELHRYYVKAVAEVIQFLAVNELILPGTYDIEECEERSLFLNLLNYTIQKDEKLSECVKCIPSYATYQSPEMQNDIIQIMAEMVTESIVHDVQNSDVPWFIIMEDGLFDRNNRENIAIGVRYVIHGKAKESILAIKSCTDLDAKTLTDLTLNVLNDCGLDSSRILSQCYNGASVMSGENGGVQALLQKQLQRKIPYVHSCNHRLHLVLVNVMNEVPEVRQFFDQCSLLQDFLKRGRIAKMDEGHTLSRLLEQRWSGHLDVIKTIFSNYKQITDALEKVKADTNIGGDYIAEAIGLLAIVKHFKFRFLLVFLKRVLETIYPADKLLQSREFNLRDSLVVLKSTLETLQSLRTDGVYQEMVCQAITKFDIEQEETKVCNRTKRQRRMNEWLKDYIITEAIGEKSEVDLTGKEHVKVIFYHALDLILSEMKRRFTDNDELLIAVSSTEADMDLEAMKYLGTLNIKLPTEAELSVVKTFLHNRRSTNGNLVVFNELFENRVAFEDTYNLLATARTFPFSTATCESTFSVLTGINRPQRVSMCPQRMANLILLAFEKERTNAIDMDNLLIKLNKKHRHLQLF